MKRKDYTIAEMSAVDFQISYVDIDARSPYNTNESHIHKECEIYLNLSGDVVFEVENRIYPISRGSVIITRPYEYHHCIYRSNELHEHYWITFATGEEETFLRFFFNREKGKDNLILLEEEELTEMSEVLQVLLQDETDSLARRIHFLRIFQILRQGKREEAIGSMEGTPDAVAKALHYMDEHLTEDMDIQSLAAAASVSANTLERYFKEFQNMSPFAMLRKKRLIYSMKFLRNGASVSEAALASGFSDYSNYIQLFRKQFGMTPLQYKKKFEEKRF